MSNQITLAEAERQFMEFMVDNGILPPNHIEADGEIHRYCIDGHKSGSKNGAYILHDNGGYYVGLVQDWTSGQPMLQWQSFSKSDYNKLPPKEKQAIKKQREYQAQQQQAELNQKYEHGKANIPIILKNTKLCTTENTHSYLNDKVITKSIESFGLSIITDNITINSYCDGEITYYKGALIIPVLDSDGNYQALQVIYKFKGKYQKRFLKDTTYQGGFIKIGSQLTQIIYICEGWTTGKSIYDATGYLVVVAFNCDNLKKVAEIIQAKVKDKEIKVVVACDNDQFTDKNAGIGKGKEISQKLGIPYTYPLFEEKHLQDKPTDFNDVYALYGLEEVKQQLGKNLTTLVDEADYCNSQQPIDHNDLMVYEASNLSDTEEQEQLLTPQTFPTLEEQGFYGALGEFTHLATENSEASKEAVLMSTLTAFSTFLGNVSKLQLGDTWIEPRLFTAIAGMSSRARKGTSFKPVIRLIKVIQQFLNRKPSYKIPTKYKNGVTPADEFPRISGLSSAEGMIFEVRDEVYKQTEEGLKIADKGVDDKRLLIVEEELGRVFKVAQREGNTLSQTLRQAFDGDVISPMTKHNRMRSTYPHINLLGHITRYELLKLTNESDVYNGLYNRFLWCCVRRSKLVPFPIPMDSDRLEKIASIFADAVYFAHQGKRLSLSPNAMKLWEATYHYISRKPVMNNRGDALTSRQESHLLRIATILALLDKTWQVEEDHLIAAGAICDYCNASVYYLFTAIDLDDDEDPDTQKIISILKEKGKLTRTEINKIFCHNKPKEQISLILSVLEGSGHIISEKEKKKQGRPTIYYKLSGIHKR